MAEGSLPALKFWIGGVARLACVPVLFLWPSGDWAWPQGWALSAIYIAYGVTMAVWLSRNDPDLLTERLKGSPVQEGQAGWDKVLMVAMLILGLAVFAAPVLDHRWAWSTVPVWLQWTALALNVPAFLLVGWVMRTNTFLARVVKVDEDRGHSVVTTGPYAIVRHPMYLGVLVAVMAMPVALGSWWGLIPAVAMCLLLVVRTLLEDRMLHAELAGYADYAKTTRFRLLPGLF